MYVEALFYSSLHVIRDYVEVNEQIRRYTNKRLIHEV